MSISVPPPEFQFNGLFFNPSFWISSTSSLTQDVANELYLQKTIPDSASALETFNGGLRANSIDVINATGIKNMFATQTAAVNMFTNLIAGSTLRIGSSVNDQSNHIGNIDILKNTINCASAPINGAIVIGDKQTGVGALDIGYSTTRGGPINIANPASACAINIGRPLTIGYTIQPIAGQIGSIYAHPYSITSGSFPTGTGAVNQTGSVVNTTSSGSPATTTIPAGVYVITATQSFNCTTAAGTTNRYNLLLRNDTLGGAPISNQMNEAPYTARTGIQGMLNLSTTVYTPGTHIFSLTYELTYTGTGVVYTAVSNQFNFLFCRVG
jgi:hypothetical protein